MEKQVQSAAHPAKQHGPTSHLPHQVRRHATNYHRPKGDRRLMDNKESVPVRPFADCRSWPGRVCPGF